MEQTGGELPGWEKEGVIPEDSREQSDSVRDGEQVEKYLMGVDLWRIVVEEQET